MSLSRLAIGSNTKRIIKCQYETYYFLTILVSSLCRMVRRDGSAMSIVYVVQGFQASERFMLKRLRPQEVPSLAAAIRRAEALAPAGGAVVVQRTQDPDADDFTPPTVVARFGHVPRDFAEAG
jgi:hypothetical protein